MRRLPVRPDHLERLEAWWLERREHHYDSIPRHWLRYNWFEFWAGMIWGHLEIWEMRIEMGEDPKGNPMPVDDE